MQHLFRKRNHFNATLNGVLVAIALSAALGVSPEVLAAPATDVKCRGCVHNADVANAAIGTTKLQNSSVTTAKLAPSAVTSSNILNGTVTGEKLAPNAVDATNIANGAVTGEKLAPNAVDATNIANGAVTAEKLAPGMLTKPKNVIYVAKEGGDFTDPGQAVNSITDASASNRYLVVIAPGEYEGGSQLSTQPYIDVAGSGEHNTIIKIDASVEASVYVLVRPDSELRDLTIEGVSDSSVKAIGLGIMNGGGGSPRLTRVTVTVTASNTTDTVAIDGNGASPVMNHVTAVATGAWASNMAIYAGTSFSAIPVIMNDTTAIATGGAHSNFAVQLTAQSANLARVTFAASGAQTENSALLSGNPSGSQDLTITDMIATSTGGSQGSAFYAYYTPQSSLTLTRSTLKGAPLGPNVGLKIYHYDAIVSHSTIVGGVVTDSNTKCVFVDDGNGGQLTSTCT